MSILETIKSWFSGSGSKITLDIVLDHPSEISDDALSKILDKAKAKKIKIPNENSLQDLNLVIGIWTDKTDSIDTELFSLRVHLQNDDYEIDITEINTDQKYLCNPKFDYKDFLQQYNNLFLQQYLLYYMYIELFLYLILQFLLQ